MTKDEHALLELLAAVDDGATDALLIASGFALDMMVSLRRRGLVTATAEHTASSKPVERLQIADAGWRALAR
jgi:hypothetical protein